MLRAVKGMGDATYARLIESLGSPEAVLSASIERLMAATSISFSVAKAVREGPDATEQNAIDAEIKRLPTIHASVITLQDPVYPPRLKAIADPPPFLYVTGELQRADHQAVAVVGSRKASAAGRVFTEELSCELASLGLTVVSGMARGIDAAAHRGALKGNGRTVAVMGCGLDQTYPPEHASLRKDVEANGAVIADLPLGSSPQGYHFPRRNRIISGMCLGVIVTEATLKSGSLITARLAIDQGREVFAVPGFVKAETSRGPNSLIKQGAKMVENVEDVIEELLPQLNEDIRQRLMRRAPSPSSAPSVADEREALVYDLLTWDGVHIDALIEKSGLSAAEVSVLLLSLELKGLLRHLPGHSYIRL